MKECFPGDRLKTFYPWEVRVFFHVNMTLIPISSISSEINTSIHRRFCNATFILIGYLMPTKRMTGRATRKLVHLFVVILEGIYDSNIFAILVQVNSLFPHFDFTSFRVRKGKFAKSPTSHFQIFGCIFFFQYHIFCRGRDKMAPYSFFKMKMYEF